MIFIRRKKVNEVIDEWFKIKKIGLKPNTIVNYKNFLGVFNEEYGDKNIHKIKSNDLYQYFMGLKPTQAKGMLKVISQIWKYAIKKHYLKRNTLEEADINIQIHSTRRYLSKRELEAFRRCELRDVEKVFWNVLLHSGLRKSECLALQRKDIDFDNNCIKVDKIVVYVPGQEAFIQHNTKTFTGIRMAPLPNALRDLLIQYMTAYDGKPNDPLLNNKSGNYYAVSTPAAWGKNLKNAIQSVDEKCLFENVNPQTFRRTFATRCYEAGVEPHIIKEWMGHSDVKITMGIYARIGVELLTDYSKLDKYSA